jgi:hypothetical protein
MRRAAMEPLDVLQQIKSVFRRFFDGAKFPEIGEIREPTLKDVFGICCGPRLFSNALKLHGEELSETPSGEGADGKAPL